MQTTTPGSWTDCHQITMNGYWTQMWSGGQCTGLTQGTPGYVLRACAEVFTNNFNLSLTHAVVPTSFTTTTIVPTLKQNAVSCLNDYRPIALTPVTVKCLRDWFWPILKTHLPFHSRPTPVCILSKQIYRRCNLCCPPHCTGSPWKTWHMCKNTLFGFNFCFQHCHS